MVMNYTEAENLVYEATNEDPWGPTGSQMKDIANYTFQYEGFHQVMNLLWKRMLEDNKTAWRRVYKAVGCLEESMFTGKLVLTSSISFSVRHRAKLILELLGDDDKLRTQRKKVKSDNKDRYQGYTSEDIRMGRGGSCNSVSASGFNDDWKDDTNQNYNRRFSHEDTREDYAVKEVNSFQFPDESRRGSVSPELGFRQDPVSDDDFGDFATARSIPQSAVTVQTSDKVRSGAVHIPALRPPAPSSTTNATATSSTSFDLLGLNASSSTVQPASSINAVHLIDTSLVTSSADTLLRDSTPVDGMELVRRGNAVSEPPLTTDLFGSNSSASLPLPNIFVSTSSPPAQVGVSQTHTGFVPSDVFSADRSANIVDTTNFTPLNPSRQPITTSPTKSALSSDEKPASVVKIGSTWADASSLIDLDNLGMKNTPVKQGLSLNQMQMNKQSFLN
ncbi:ENTH domain protein [Necator americanus]|uniref:ENTH domain protein n=1 Tax=Necator americanus TaxID=51031 RepID=W2TH42_NECAM|nr:ENTH domain protein [Necator americanus]ETN80317.1 ENTH domain protein [Necator americanus]